MFVHGAWHGGWAFDRVASELERRGHVTLAPDLPCDEPGLTVHDYAAVVGPQPDAVVVGHSLGGLTIPFVPARVRVFLAALVACEDTFGALDPSFGGTERDRLGRSFWPHAPTARTRLLPRPRRGGRGVRHRAAAPTGAALTRARTARRGTGVDRHHP